MTIETAYDALAALIEASLTATEFLPLGERLQIDPESPFEPSGDETDVVRSAALVKVRTYVARQTLGRPAGQRRFVVERECRLELGIAGPNRDRRLTIKADTLAALAQLPETQPTLGGACERVVLAERTDDELPPNGVATFLTFTLRVRSGDPLGLSA